MRFSSAFLTILLVVLLTPSLDAISIRHDVPEQEYFDLAAQFPAAGSVRRNGAQWCSGSLVAPDKVLTAAHCTGGGNYSFRLGANANSATHTRSVISTAVNPGYTGNERGDFAVLTLASPINDVTPMQISMQDPAGLIGTTMGYGYHGNGIDFNFASDALSRAAHNLINVASSTTIRTDFDHPNGSTSTYNPASALALEGTTAGGDSGGALTVDFGQGEVIVGVLHGGFNNFGVDSRYGDISIWAPVNRASNISFLENQGLTVLDGTISGDFNGDGAFDCLDINVLTSAIADGGGDGDYDLNGDGTVDLSDRDEWLAVAGSVNLLSGNPYLLGDMDLNGVVDGADFINWNDHRFTSDSAYCNGDLNADGFVDGVDFTLWNDNRFQSSDAYHVEWQQGFTRPFTGTSAVPEPSSALMLLSIAMLASRRRR